MKLRPAEQEACARTRGQRKLRPAEQEVCPRTRGQGKLWLQGMERTVRPVQLEPRMGRGVWGALCSKCKPGPNQEAFEAS